MPLESNISSVYYIKCYAYYNSMKLLIIIHLHKVTQHEQFFSIFKNIIKFSVRILLFRIFTNFIYHLTYPILFVSGCLLVFFFVIVGIFWVFWFVFSILSIPCFLYHDGDKMLVPDEDVELKVGRKS